MALANGIGLLQAGYPEKEPGSVPHLPPIRRPVVPDMANVPTAKGVLNSNFRCGVTCSCRGDLPGTSLAGQLTLRNPMRLSGRRGYLVCASDRDRGAPHDAAPPTPPGIRVTYLGGSIGLSFSMQPGFRVLSSSGPVR